MTTAAPSLTAAASFTAVGASFCGFTVIATLATLLVAPLTSSIVYEKLSPTVSLPSWV